MGDNLYKEQSVERCYKILGISSDDKIPFNNRKIHCGGCTGFLYKLNTWELELMEKLLKDLISTSFTGVTK